MFGFKEKQHKYSGNLCFVIKIPSYKMETLGRKLKGQIGDCLRKDIVMYDMGDNYCVMLLDTNDVEFLAQFIDRVLTNSWHRYTYAKVVNGKWKAFRKPLDGYELEPFGKKLVIYPDSDDGIYLLANKMVVRYC